MELAWNICAPLGTLSTFFFNPVFQVSTAKNEINLFNNHVLIVAPVTFAPAGAMTPSAEFLCFDQHGLSVPDLINEFPNHVRPDQMSHTTASDLGIIDCFFFFFFFFVDCRNTRV